MTEDPPGPARRTAGVTPSPTIDTKVHDRCWTCRHRSDACGSIDYVPTNVQYASMIADKMSDDPAPDRSLSRRPIKHGPDRRTDRCVLIIFVRFSHAIFFLLRALSIPPSFLSVHPSIGLNNIRRFPRRPARRTKRIGRSCFRRLAVGSGPSVGRLCFRRLHTDVYTYVRITSART